MAWSELERRLAIHLSGNDVAIAGATSYYVDLRRSRRHEFYSPTLPFLPAVSDARVEDIRTKAHRLLLPHFGGGSALREYRQQRSRLLEVSRVKAFREPTVDWGQEFVRLGALAWLLPEATQVHGGAELPGLRLLLAGNDQRLLEARLGPGGVRHILLQQQDTMETMCFRERIALAGSFELLESLGQQAQACLHLARMPQSFGEQA